MPPKLSGLGRIKFLVIRLLRYVFVAGVSCLFGATALYIYMVRSGPPLQLWHTVDLTAEFTADRADEIQSFDDYRRLEDQLFKQLDDEVYNRIETGPAFALARFSANSAADPHRWNPNWNRSFELEAQSPRGGVLLLHGMSDSPYSLRALATELNENGYWVIGLRLPGHGTAPAGLTAITWQDLASAVRLGMNHLASRVGQGAVHIVGYSMGAALALNYTLDLLEDNNSKQELPASLVLISPAIGLSRIAMLAKWKRRLAVLPGLEKFAWSDIQPEFDPFKYNSFSTNAAEQVNELTHSVAQRMAARASAAAIEDFPPTLVFQSTVDATVTTDAVIDHFFEHLAPEQHELVLFDINRVSVASTILVSDPGPLTARLMTSPALAFALTLVANESDKSPFVNIRRKEALSTQVSKTPSHRSWPDGVISLSHVALPFPPDDPLYGQQKPAIDGSIYLGQIALRGERGLLAFPADWLMRLRYNPFYDYLSQRVMAWIDNADG